MIDNAKLIGILASRRACEHALEWLEQRNSDKMWTQCKRPDWMLWWAAPYVPRQELVRVTCKCARLALPYVAAGELRPLRTIETTEAWTRGEATLEEVRSAARAAFAATYADDRAASAAAEAAAFIADVADVANFANAADVAAYAAAYAADAAGSAAQAQMCELIRQKWPKCPEPGVKG